MRFQLPTIPQLPLAWPYEPRPLGAAPLQQNAVALPGLGEDWSLFALPTLSFGEALDFGDSFGRGGVQRWGEIVTRPYRRGGLVRHVNQRIYPTPQRFAHEFIVHRALWLAGFPTVEPLGYGWKRRCWGFEGVFLTRFTESDP
ncbi:MAG: hypothetical protein Q8O00_06745, partial [Holophaga sp.]|nr:hypothetical protein [Holophaga sp.]